MGHTKNEKLVLLLQPRPSTRRQHNRHFVNSRLRASFVAAASVLAVAGAVACAVGAGSATHRARGTEEDSETGFATGRRLN